MHWVTGWNRNGKTSIGNVIGKSNKIKTVEIPAFGNYPASSIDYIVVDEHSPTIVKLVVELTDN